MSQKGRKNSYPTASRIVIEDSSGKVLDLIGLPCETEVTISFDVAGNKDFLKPIYFKTAPPKG